MYLGLYHFYGIVHSLVREVDMDGDNSGTFVSLLLCKQHENTTVSLWFTEVPQG